MNYGILHDLQAGAVLDGSSSTEVYRLECGEIHPIYGNGATVSPTLSK